MTFRGDLAGAVQDLTIAKAPSNQITLSWDASCSVNDDDYEIYEGTIGTFQSHGSLVCTTNGNNTKTVVPSAGDRYYLVVPRNADREGSYGTDSSNVPRTLGTPACLTQLLGSCASP